MAKERIRKTNFRPDSLERIEQLASIVDEYQQQGLRLTARQLYYQCVSRDLCANTPAEYKKLTALLTDARYAGMIDWGCVTRAACPLCALELNTHVLARHVGKRKCLGRQAAEKLFARGLHAVELKFQAKSDHVNEALRRFGFDVELHDTRGRLANNESGGRHRATVGMEAWTSEDGVALALIIEEAARLLGTSYPEAARRLWGRQDLIGPFGVAWKLGPPKKCTVVPGPEDEVLKEILQPINWTVGSDGKRRLRKPSGVIVGSE